MAQINNDHTRRAYLKANRRFADWCAQQNIDQLSRVGLTPLSGSFPAIFEEILERAPRICLASL